METTFPRRYFLCAMLLGTIAAGNVAPVFAASDPVAEMASFSVFDKTDLAQLAKTDLKAAHGVPMKGVRFGSVQSCYVAAGSPAQQMAAMRDWSPARHSELKVFLHGDLPGGVTAASFSKLAEAPDNRAVRALAAATQKHSNELQLSVEEARKLPPEGAVGAVFPPNVAAFWSQLLSTRAQAFSTGGAAAQQPYENAGAPVRASEELRGLLSQQEKIRHQFSGLIDSTGIGRGAGSLKPEMYWELLQADENAALTLGASYSKPGPNGSFQAADTLYYSSGGYYAGLTLYQLWPVDIAGKASTLVWRGDFISTASLAELHGIERIASEGQMVKDISRAVTFFRRDTSGGR